MDDDLRRFLERMAREAADGGGSRGGPPSPDPLGLRKESWSTSQEACGRLLTACARFLERHAFEPGQLVWWKPGMKNRRYPLPGQPAVVVEVLREPAFAKEDSGSAYYREPLDLALGLVDADGDFLIYHFDSRRFQPVAGSD